MNEETALDLRGNPTHQCICGCDEFFVKAKFEDYELSMYYLDMQCSNCGNLLTAPTPLDKEGMQ